MARFKVYKTVVYQDHLIPPINVITEELSNQKHQPDSYLSATRKMMQERKTIKFVNKFAENFKWHDDLPENLDIHNIDLNSDKRNAALRFYWNSKDGNTSIITI